MGCVDGVWSVVVPVKPLAVAKSRLRGALPGVPHERLVLAVVRDTVAAVAAAPGVGEVIVVTDEPAVTQAATELGARTVPDRPGAGLNPAVAHGAAAADGHPVAALAGDLPALRPAELAAALGRVGNGAAGRAFVADAAGTGTTLLAAAAGVPLDPRFGPGSAAAHRASGATALVGDWPGLRRDVDTGADLAAAAVLGLGPATSALYGAAMQGTVATFDAAARTGTVLLDDGTEVPFPASAFAASGLRLLRLGQRVRLDRRDGAVVALSLITMRPDA
jgi:2-phospho-L-lactate/phosphoenolpyruvate guanylyltransferase